MKHSNGFLCLVVVCAVLIVCSDIAKGTTIKLKNQAYVSGDFVTLADVAMLSDAETVSGKLAHSIYLGLAPEEKETVTVTTGDITVALQQHGINFAEVNIVGPLSCSVYKGQDPHKDISVQGSSPASARLKEIIEEYVHKTAHLKSSEAVVSLQYVPDDAEKYMDGSYILEVEKENIAAYSQTLRPIVRVCDEGEIISRLNITAELTVTRDVVVAQRNIERDSVISYDNVVIKRIKVEREMLGAISDTDQITACRAKKYIRAGDVVMPDMVEIVPCVFKGDVVAVVYKGKGFKIETQGIAQTDGAAGEQITLRSVKDRKKILQGTVVAKGKVEVR